MAGTLPSVAVTGASGFVGRALVSHLHVAGRKVVAISRGGASPPVKVSDIRVDSYLDPMALRVAFAGIDAVVHLAAHAHRGGTPEEFAASRQATAAVLQAAADAGVRRFVFVSSIGVHGNVTHASPFTEDSPLAPVEPYAASKLEAERLVTASPLQTVILRPPLVHGPQAPGNFGRLMQAVRRGWWLPLGAVHNARTLIGRDNLLDLIGLCVDHPAATGQAFVAGDAEDLSTPEIVRSLADGMGRPARMLSLPPAWLRAGATLAGRPRLAESLCASLQVDSAKARRLLGWQPRLTAQEGLRQAAREEVAT